MLSAPLLRPLQLPTVSETEPYAQTYKLIKTAEDIRKIATVLRFDIESPDELYIQVEKIQDSRKRVMIFDKIPEIISRNFGLDVRKWE